MKKKERFLIWGFIVVSLAVIGYFGTKIFQWNEFAPEKPRTPAAPVARTIKIELNGPADLQSWNRHSFHGENEVEVNAEPDGAKSLKVVSRSTSSALFKPVTVSTADQPVFSWQWKIKKFPAGRKNKVFGAPEDSDFAARVSVIFKSALPLQQDIVQYVWDDRFPAGTHGENPSWKKIKILVVRGGPPANPDEWVSEKRDVTADYKLLFGKFPEKDIEAIGVMADSDDTKTETEARFRNFQIETLHTEEPEISSRTKIFPIPLAPVFKKTGRFFESAVKISAEKVPRTVFGAAKRAATWPVRKIEESKHK